MKINQPTAMIIGTATGIPDGVIDQDVAAGIVQRLGLTKRWNKVLPKLYLKSGVLRRSSVLLGPPNDLDPDSRQTFYKPPTDAAPWVLPPRNGWRFMPNRQDPCSKRSVFQPSNKPAWMHPE